jgi:hypothetical protein
MAKRLVWFGVGAASGCVAAVWGLSSVRRASQRFSTDRVPTEVAGAVRRGGQTVRHDLRDAVDEGRAAMRARERELRAGLERTRSVRTGTGARPVVR